MGNALSGNSKKKITDVDKAILTLKTQRGRITDQKKRVESAIDRENAVAKSLVAAGKKDRALLALKKRRLHEMQLTKLDDWLLNVESTLANVESAANLVQLTNALKQGNAVLKDLQQQVTVEDVEKLMQDTAEAAEYQERLQMMLGESWTGQDESEAEAALAALQDEVALEARVEVEAELPAVPTHEAVTAKIVKEGEEEVMQPTEPTERRTEAPMLA